MMDLKKKQIIIGVSVSVGVVIIAIIIGVLIWAKKAGKLTSLTSKLKKTKLIKAVRIERNGTLNIYSVDLMDANGTRINNKTTWTTEHGGLNADWPEEHPEGPIATPPAKASSSDDPTKSWFRYVAASPLDIKKVTIQKAGWPSRMPGIKVILYYEDNTICMTYENTSKEDTFAFDVVPQ